MRQPICLFISPESGQTQFGSGPILIDLIPTFSKGARGRAAAGPSLCLPTGMPKGKSKAKSGSPSGIKPSAITTFFSPTGEAGKKPQSEASRKRTRVGSSHKEEGAEAGLCRTPPPPAGDIVVLDSPPRTDEVRRYAIHLSAHLLVNSVLHTRAFRNGPVHSKSAKSA